VTKHIALFEVKTVVDSGDPNGEFEAILSVPTVDRDGEVIKAGAFAPLPESIPIHAFHDFSSPVAVAQPYYEGDVLMARGVFDPDPNAQMIRGKVGRSIGFMSVGFMDTTRIDVDGVPTITKAELLEASFVSVPSNRQAAILAVKAHRESFEMKATKGDRLQQIHDLAIANGAKCASGDEPSKSPDTDTETKAAASASADDSAAADPAPLADVNRGHLARVAALAAEAELLLLPS
jgi:HK97 family phage prohead protease